jgi:hypothetical protein
VKVRCAPLLRFQLPNCRAPGELPAQAFPERFQVSLPGLASIVGKRRESSSLPDYLLASAPRSATHGTSFSGKKHPVRFCVRSSTG